ncbi:MAG TPA: GNAT family protein [Candidatus Limnocylindrales bacterium]|nr:GNAT family protein [Candidatus Limnocylindrales bacterium]
MAYPAEWETEFTAKNGKLFFFRPKKSSDTEMLWAMFSTLSETSLLFLVPPYTRERIEGWTNNIDFNDVLTVVAVVEEIDVTRIVGLASLKFNPLEVFKHKAELAITVHDDYQNLGVGTALINRLVDLARKKNLKKIFLTVNTENARAIHVYQKTGFEIEGILRKDICLNGKYLDEYLMALFL